MREIIYNNSRGYWVFLINFKIYWRLLYVQILKIEKKNKKNEII